LDAVSTPNLESFARCLTLPVGTAYAVWVGVGAIGTVILGIVLLDEPVNATRLISVTLIVAGIVGLKLATPG